jgi:hypothetical protein
MYKLTKLINGKLKSIIWQQDDILVCIPVDEDNADYQKYLKWVEAGNTPEPADE